MKKTVFVLVALAGAVLAAQSPAVLTPAQLSMLLEGIDWRMPVFVRRPELAG